MVGRRLAPTLALLLLAAPTPAPRADAVTPPLGRAATTSGENPPNVVLIVADDLRLDMMWAMPEVRSRIGGEVPAAASHGVTFSNGFVVNPVCCPSRASILTGQYSHTTGVWTNTEPDGGFTAFDDSSTMATWLDAAGYRTGLIGKYLNGYGPAQASYVPPGWDEWFGVTKNSYFGYEVSHNGVQESYGHAPRDYQTDVLARRAAQFVRRSPSDTPFFLYLSPKAVHDVPVPAPRHAELFADLAPWRPPSFNEGDIFDKPRYVRGLPMLDRAARTSLDRFRRDQYRTLVGLDEAVGRVLDALEVTGRISETLIVFTSDNGFQWGEHRKLGKDVPYEESIRVPLIVRYDPLLTQTGTRSELALNIDLAPTIADLAGVEAPAVDGESLVPLLTAEAETWRTDFAIEHLTGGAPAYCAVRTRTHIYVAHPTGEEELYDLVKDPYQLDSRHGDPFQRPLLDELRRRAQDLCDPPPPGFMFPSADVGITTTESRDPAVVGRNLAYRLAVRNDGPTGAAGVMVTIPLPRGVSFQGASFGCGLASSTVTCSLGTVPEGHTRLRAIVVRPTAANPSLSSTVSVSSTTPDPVPENNSDTETSEVDPAFEISVSAPPAPAIEADRGSTPMVFTVTRSPAPDRSATVRFRTREGTADEGDYAGTRTTLTFAPGQSTVRTTVLVVGDLLEEGVEEFDVVLSSPTAGAIEDRVAVGTIEDDGDICTIVGTPGADTLVGGPERDVLCGLGGGDAILGRDEDDLLIGGDGSDRLLGGAGVDELLAGDGSDEAFGGLGRDLVNGQNGADVLWGDASRSVNEQVGGPDTMVGGAGDDRIHGQAGNDPVLVGNRGLDRIHGGPGNDVLRGGGPPDRDVLVGGPGEEDRCSFESGSDGVRDQSCELPSKGTDHVEPWWNPARAR